MNKSKRGRKAASALMKSVGIRVARHSIERQMDIREARADKLSRQWDSWNEGFLGESGTGTLPRPSLPLEPIVRNPQLATPDTSQVDIVVPNSHIAWSTDWQHRYLGSQEGRCSFHGCPFPASTERMDRYFEVPVCANHSRFLEVESGDVDFDVLELFRSDTHDVPRVHGTMRYDGFSVIRGSYWHPSMKLTGRSKIRAFADMAFARRERQRQRESARRIVLEQRESARRIEAMWRDLRSRSRGIYVKPTVRFNPFAAVHFAKVHAQAKWSELADRLASMRRGDEFVVTHQEPRVFARQLRNGLNGHKSVRNIRRSVVVVGPQEVKIVHAGAW